MGVQVNAMIVRFSVIRMMQTNHENSNGKAAILTNRGLVKEMEIATRN
jgi:hypothetical protein